MVGTRRKPKPVKVRESDIQKAILEYLNWHGYDHWRSYIGPVVRGSEKAGYRYSKNPMAGYPDITGFLRNNPRQMFCCEVKAQNGVLSDKQKAWLELLKIHGIPTIVPRSLDQFVANLRSLEQDAQQQRGCQ